MSSAEDVSFRTESYSVAVGQASDVKESSFIKAFSTATATKAAVDRPSSTPGNESNDNSKDRVESEVNVETPQQITPSSYRKYTEKLGWLWLFLSFWYVRVEHSGGILFLYTFFIFFFALFQTSRDWIFLFITSSFSCVLFSTMLRRFKASILRAGDVSCMQTVRTRQRNALSPPLSGFVAQIE